MEVETKDAKVKSLVRELDELRNDTASEEESRKLKRQKQDLENRLKEQAEELDELTGQIQVLESSKISLERTMGQLKTEHQRQLEMKEEELEDLKAGFGKKMKVLEQQLEQEHEERMGFVREKHDLESKIMNLQDMLDRSGDEDLVLKLRRDLKRTKALLKDAHLFMEKNQQDGTNKVIMRQLKNQVNNTNSPQTSEFLIE